MVKRATIVDIADASGVSVATVSRVLSGSGYPVNKHTKERILRIAKELGYTPNVFSRALKGKPSRHIGVLVPSIDNPFYSVILNSVEQICIEEEYIPLICCSLNSQSLEARLLDLFAKEQVSGLLVSCMSWSKEVHDLLESLGIPYVVFDQVGDRYTGDFVGFDFFAAGQMVVSYLAGMGHEDIVLATGPISRTSRKQFSDGFRAECEARGIICRILETGSAAGDYETGEELARMILSQPARPTAVSAINDITALGIIRSLYEAGISVPEDISVIGFDDIPFAKMVTPPLTTIRQPAAETGAAAVRMLISRIKGIEPDENNLRFEPELIERSSVSRRDK